MITIHSCSLNSAPRMSYSSNLMKCKAIPSRIHLAQIHSLWRVRVIKIQPWGFHVNKFHYISSRRRRIESSHRVTIDSICYRLLICVDLIITTYPFSETLHFNKSTTRKAFSTLYGNHQKHWCQRLGLDPRKIDVIDQVRKDNYLEQTYDQYICNGSSHATVKGTIC